MTAINLALLLAVAILWTDQISAKSIHGNNEIRKESDHVVLEDRVQFLDYQQTVLEDTITMLKDKHPMLESQLPVFEDQHPELDDQISLLKDNMPELQHKMSVLVDNLAVLKDEMPALPDQLAVLVNELTVLEDHLTILEDHLPGMQDTDTEVESKGTEMKNQLPVKSETSRSSEIFETADTECTFPFEKVGRNCYMYTDTKLSYDNAKAYCESLSQGRTHDISLGMLGYSEEEDQDFLDTVSSKNNTFWVGGHSEDNLTYRWLDNREINLRAQFWAVADPIDKQCIVAQSQYYHDNITRSYLHTHNCEESLNFICQMQIECPEAFHRIGNYCYMRSEDFGIPYLSWSGARQYCSSLAMPDGYHADLAVLGLQDQNVYKLMNTLADADYDNEWIGASLDEGCKYTWIDGRELSAQSMYWFDFNDYYDFPLCEDDYDTILFNDHDFNRPSIADYNSDSSLPFICQVFKDM